MDMFVEELGNEEVNLTPPVEERREEAAIGPGGLVNVSAFSRKFAVSGGVKTPEKKKSGAKVHISKRRTSTGTISSEEKPKRRSNPDGMNVKQHLLATSLHNAAMFSKPAKLPAQRATAAQRRSLALFAIVTHMVVCRVLGGDVWIVGACGAAALYYSLSRHDNDASLADARARIVEAVVGVWSGSKAVCHQIVGLHGASVRRFSTSAFLSAQEAACRCPQSLREIAGALIASRLALLLLGQQKMALLARLGHATAAASLGGFCDGPSRAAVFAGLCWFTITILDWVSNSKFGFALVMVAWLTRPSITRLDAHLARSRRRNEEHPPMLRTRNVAFVLTLAAVNTRPDQPKQRDALYLGLFSTWFRILNNPHASSADDDSSLLFERIILMNDD